MISGGNSSGGEDPCSYDGKRKAEMTAEERAKHDRERNRVHARNTRARKKQYMEELKERVENMHAQRVSENCHIPRGLLLQQQQCNSRGGAEALPNTEELVAAVLLRCCCAYLR